jgi:hypothetical protein
MLAVLLHLFPKIKLNAGGDDEEGDLHGGEEGGQHHRQVPPHPIQQGICCILSPNS